jgi:hypothetical protein
VYGVRAIDYVNRFIIPGGDVMERHPLDVIDEKLEEMTEILEEMQGIGQEQINQTLKFFGGRYDNEF